MTLLVKPPTHGHKTTDETADRSSWTRVFLKSDAGGSFRPDVEGLRAIAVLMVLLYHANVPLPGGLVGVDVFFVISGFIITGTLLKELEVSGNISIRGFYGRRAKRLLPATLIVLAATALLTFAVIPKVRWLGIAKDIFASTFYVMNWRLSAVATDYTAQDQAHSPLQHFWSLAVEEQFYLVWPALLLVVTFWPRRRLRRSDRSVTESTYTRWLLAGMALIAIPSLAWSVYYTHRNPAGAYFVTWTRLWELAIGGGVAIAAHLLVRTPRPLAAVLTWLGLGMILASAFVINDQTAFPGYAALLPTVGTAAVIAFMPAAQRAGPHMLLAFRPMVWIGALSYSLYLWHWPLIVAAEAKLGHPLTWEQGLAVVGVAGVLAWASYWLVENRVRRARTFRVPARALRLGAACMIASSALAVALLAALYPPPQPAAQQVVAVTNHQGAQVPKTGAMVLAAHPRNDPAGAPRDKVASITPDPLNATEDQDGAECIASQEAVTPKPCIFGDASAKTTVALVGDSHAAQWILPLDAVARHRGWRLEVFVKQNCPFTDVSVMFEKQLYGQCSTWNDRLASLLARQSLAMVVTSSVEHAIVGDPRELNSVKAPTVAGFEERWQPLLSAGARVAVLADTPRPGIDIHECVSQHTNSLTKCAFPRSTALMTRSSLTVAARATPGVRYIDLSDAICPTDRCAAVIGNVLVYRDTNHLTATYAGTLAPRLNRRLPRV